MCYDFDVIAMVLLLSAQVHVDRAGFYY